MRSGLVYLIVLMLILPGLAAAQGNETHSYKVKPGDSLWKIAEYHLGSGALWPEIIKANPSLKSANDLKPGMELVIPKIKPKEPPKPAPLEPNTFKVEKGESLWTLAGKHLGDATRWPELLKANPQLKSANDLKPGMILRLPIAETTIKPIKEPVTVTEPKPKPVKVPVEEPVTEIVEKRPLPDWAKFDPDAIPDSQIRKTSFPEKFYPTSGQRLTTELDSMLENSRKRNLANVRGLIVPNSAYEYSGQTAADTFRQVSGRYFDTVILITPSHQVGFNGVSINRSGYYQTPLGLVPVNSEMARKIIDSHESFKYVPKVHNYEHGIEVQLPFLQKTLAGPFRIVPIIMGSQEIETARSLGDVLAEIIKENKDVLIVGTLTLSEYKPYNSAVALDRKTMKAIQNYDISDIYSKHEKGEIETDGRGIVAAVKTAMIQNNIRSMEIIRYTNSGDVSGRKDAVAGFAGLAFYDPRPLTPEEGSWLIKKARESIMLAAGMETGKPLRRLSTTGLRQTAGVIVTITKNGVLRGTTGNDFPIGPLKKAISAAAARAAVSDYRFPKIRPEEMSDIRLEISVIYTPREIDNPRNIQVGQDGLIVQYRGKSGMIMPRKAEDSGWDRETLLDMACLQARLPEKIWQVPETRLFTFRSDTFPE